MIGKGDIVNNLYILNKHAVCESSLSAVFCGSLLVDGSTWHQRLGHPSAAKLKTLSGTLSLSPSNFTYIDHCPVCPLAKQRRMSFPSHNHMSDTPFALLHLDTWGPFAKESIDGFKYFLTIVDDYSRVTWVYMLRIKMKFLLSFPSLSN